MVGGQFARKKHLLQKRKKTIRRRFVVVKKIRYPNPNPDPNESKSRPRETRNKKQETEKRKERKKRNQKPHPRSKQRLANNQTVKIPIKKPPSSASRPSWHHFHSHPSQTPPLSPCHPSPSSQRPTSSAAPHAPSLPRPTPPPSS